MRGERKTDEERSLWRQVNMYNEAVARMGKRVFVNPQNFPGSATSGSHLGVGRGVVV